MERGISDAWDLTRRASTTPKAENGQTPNNYLETQWTLTPTEQIIHLVNPAPTVGRLDDFFTQHG